jgi:hypothetical protein
MLLEDQLSLLINLAERNRLETPSPFETKAEPSDTRE